MSDLIKREDAIKAIDDAFDSIPMEQTTEILTVRRAIRTLPSADRPHVGYTGVDEDYLVSVQEVFNITAETGALETQRRVRELARRDRPQGEWMYTDNPLRLNDEWKCSRCGNISFVKTNFCDRCGAHMKGADDDN